MKKIYLKDYTSFHFHFLFVLEYTKKDNNAFQKNAATHFFNQSSDCD